MDKAVEDLTTVYLPEFAEFLAGATDLPQDALEGLIKDHVLTTKAIVDAQGAGDAAAAAAADREAGDAHADDRRPARRRDRGKALPTSSRADPHPSTSKGPAVAAGPFAPVPEKEAPMPRRILLIGLLATALAACSSSLVIPRRLVGVRHRSPPDAIELSVPDFMLDQSGARGHRHRRSPWSSPTMAPPRTTSQSAPQAGEVLMTTADLSRGEAETITAELPPGEYVTFCSLPGHESLGIKGTLTVTAP